MSTTVGELEVNLETQIPSLDSAIKEKGKESPTDFVDEQKHQLQNLWKFWYFENNKERSWSENLRVVSPFTTVEDFWSVYNHIKSATEIRNGCSYFVFKEGLRPEWEDTGNREGGRWLINFDRRQRSILDEKWLEVLLCLIGEAFDDDGDDICGAAVDIRSKTDKISVWTADCKNKDRIMNIGRKIKDRLGLDHQTQMTYERHADTANKNTSVAKHMFSL